MIVGERIADLSDCVTEVRSNLETDLLTILIVYINYGGEICLKFDETFAKRSQYFFECGEEEHNLKKKEVYNLMVLFSREELVRFCDYSVEKNLDI